MTVSRTPYFERRIASFTIQYRFTPPVACSIRILGDEIRRFIVVSGEVSSPTRGFSWVETLSHQTAESPGILYLDRDNSQVATDTLPDLSRSSRVPCLHSSHSSNKCTRLL